MITDKVKPAPAARLASMILLVAAASTELIHGAAAFAIAPPLAALGTSRAAHLPPQRPRWVPLRDKITLPHFMGSRDPDFFTRSNSMDVLRSPKSSGLKSDHVGMCQLGSFQVPGQGAVGFRIVPNENEDIYFEFEPREGASGNTVASRIDSNGWEIWDKVTNEPIASVSGQEGKNILRPGTNQTFWMSFDKEHSIIRGGTGYLLTALQLWNRSMADHTIYTMKYGELSPYSVDNPREVAANGRIDLIQSKYPIYKDLPPIVKAHDEITLEDLDKGSAISIKELSPECQRLYESVAGPNIQIDTPDFPDFTQGIDYSIKFGFVRNKLEEKARKEFESGSSTYDANETYLRVTLGSNEGDSPGIPYVIEIWPPGCYSPIHDHSQANSIIKVLHGSLTTRWYAGLDRSIENPVPYGQGVLSTGQVTWLDDRQFQTHQLFNHNVNGTACITLQCYMYNDSDNRHYENFDYIGGDKKIYPFTPNSDYDFITFKELIRHEWTEYKAQATPKPDYRKV